MGMDQEVCVLFENSTVIQEMFSVERRTINLVFFGIQIERLSWKSRRPFIKRTWNSGLIYLCKLISNEAEFKDH